MAARPPALLTMQDTITQGKRRCWCVQWWHLPGLQIVEDSIVVSEGLFEIHFEAAALPVLTVCRVVAGIYIILKFLFLI